MAPSTWSASMGCTQKPSINKGRSEPPLLPNQPLCQAAPAPLAFAHWSVWSPQHHIAEWTRVTLDPDTRRKTGIYCSKFWCPILLDLLTIELLTLHCHDQSITDAQQQCHFKRHAAQISFTSHPQWKHVSLDSKGLSDKQMLHTYIIEHQSRTHTFAQTVALIYYMDISPPCSAGFTIKTDWILL